MGWNFDAPGNLQDFKNSGDWSKAMTAEADGIIKTLVADVLDKSEEEVTEEDIVTWHKKLAYVHPELELIPPEAKTVAINPWGGFPRLVERLSPWTKDFPPIPGDATGTLRAVETLGDEDFARGEFRDVDGKVLDLPVRHRQDEYLEWASEVDGQGNLTKITFVAEGYDYFARLFEVDETAVADLYHQFTGVKVTPDQLRATRGIVRHYADPRRRPSRVAEVGAFNPRNFFNIKPGIVHLSQRANSLGAEVNLAGVSALARKKVDGSLVNGVDEEELMCCNAGGEPNRNSDPKISQQAYNQVLAGKRYTLANPVGLYIASVDRQGLTLKNGDPVSPDWWNVVRGHDLWTPGASRVLRLELRPPPGEATKLSELFAAGAPLRFPGQVAKLLTVHLFITAWDRAGGGHGPDVPCIGTCCRVNGTPVLEFADDRRCGQGSTLAFPGLVAPPKAPHGHEAMLAAVHQIAVAPNILAGLPGGPIDAAEKEVAALGAIAGMPAIASMTRAHSRRTR